VVGPERAPIGVSVLLVRRVRDFCGLPGDDLPFSVAAQECAGVAIIGDGGWGAGAVLFVRDQAESYDGGVWIFVDGDVFGRIFCLAIGARRTSGAGRNTFDDVGFIGDGAGGVSVDDVVGEEAVEAGDVIGGGVL
jgi:hypothetical protein